MRSRAASMSLNEITPAQCSRKIDNRQDRQSVAARRGERDANGLTCGCASGRWRLQLRIEDFAHFGGELLGIERLGQKKHSVIAPIARMERFFEIPGDKNNFRV